MVDEPSSRCSSFYPGSELRLADGQAWTFPAPTREWTLKTWPAAQEYSRLIQAMIEAQDDFERGLAELAFAIFLLGQNYRLSAGDYQQLLDFGPESVESARWQIALHDLAQEHVMFAARVAGIPPQVQFVPSRGKFSRLLAWLRSNLSFRWWVFGSRSW
jgi:hypothetical protein